MTFDSDGSSAGLFSEFSFSPITNNRTTDYSCRNAGGNTEGLGFRTAVPGKLA